MKAWNGWGRTKSTGGALPPSVMESVLRDPQKEGEMGGISYAVISAKYLNFSSRLGYHFATLDTYCGRNINNNYITFYFKGGAADIDRRTRRARAGGLDPQTPGISAWNKRAT